MSENPEQISNVTEAYRSKSTDSSAIQKSTKKSVENFEQKHEKTTHKTAPQDVAMESSTPALTVPDELETVKVQSGNQNGSFTVSKKFWELASQNTKQIFSTLPNKFIKSFKNPCFWQQFQGQITRYNFMIRLLNSRQEFLTIIQTYSGPRLPGQTVILNLLLSNFLTIRTFDPSDILTYHLGRQLRKHYI